MPCSNDLHVTYTLLYTCLLCGTIILHDPSLWYLSAGTTAIGICAHEAKGSLEPFKFTRRALGPKDVSIQIAKVGICHSDLHQVLNEWQNSVYPIVPGCVTILHHHKWGYALRQEARE